VTPDQESSFLASEIWCKF